VRISEARARLKRTYRQWFEEVDAILAANIRRRARAVAAKRERCAKIAKSDRSSERKLLQLVCAVRSRNRTATCRSTNPTCVESSAGLRTHASRQHDGGGT